MMSLKTWSQATAQVAGSSDNTHSLKARGVPITDIHKSVARRLRGIDLNGCRGMFVSQHTGSKHTKPAYNASALVQTALD